VPRILIVDDDADVLSFMADALDGHGYDVRSLQNSVHASAILGEEKFDLIVTDIVMPTVHGLEILERAKRRSPAAPVIFVTGHPQQAILDEGMEKGALDVLEKPFSAAEFQSVVSRALAATVDR
jgi:DNA-binding NtrC family response regulator